MEMDDNRIDHGKNQKVINRSKAGERVILYAQEISAGGKNMLVLQISLLSLSRNEGPTKYREDSIRSRIPINPRLFLKLHK